MSTALAEQPPATDAADFLDAWHRAEHGENVNERVLAGLLDRSEGAVRTTTDRITADIRL